MRTCPYCGARDAGEFSYRGAADLERPDRNGENAEQDLRDNPDVLAKGCQVDLHDAAFPAGAAATTQIDQMACQLWRTDDAPTYGLLVNRSLAQCLWSWVATSAAEYRYEVAAP